ncbi:MAG: hypothetical protein CMJ90_04295 [Planctomycetes bacterium]|nr:hypothetical protein [Planctomycetota bacterium]
MAGRLAWLFPLACTMQRTMRRPAVHHLGSVLLAVLVVCSGVVPAQTNEQVDTSIASGVQWMLAAQTSDGSWRGSQFENYRGFTALCAYTLLKCGLPKDHPSVRLAFDWLDRQEFHRTYDLGCALMAYEALGKGRRPMELIREYAKKLVGTAGNGQRKNGGRWGYPGNHSGADMGWTDLSNTQFAVLGLRAARRCGVKIGSRSLWTRVAQGLIQDQDSYGGFGYRGGEKHSASMTCAGITGLVLCREVLEDVNAEKGVLGKVRVGIKRGFMWLEKNWAIDRAIDYRVKGHNNAVWHYYYMYGLERVCAFTDTARIGDHDWHAEGAKLLVGAQQSPGCWKGNETDTCFALLFLRRGSRTSGLGPRAAIAHAAAKDAAFSVGMSGDRPLVAWIRTLGTVRGLLDQGDEVEELRWRVNGSIVRRVEAPARAALLEAPCHLQYGFEKNGRYAIQCEMEIQPIDAHEKVAVYKSNVVEFTVDDVEEPWHREATRDHARQLLHRGDVVARASSEAWGWSRALYAVDQRHASAWWCKNDDVRPRIVLDLSHASRASAIKLTQAHPHTLDPKGRARAKDIEIRVNNGKPMRYRLRDDPKHKQLVRFPKTSVRSLRIDVLSTYRGHRRNEESVVGFKEIELFLDPHPDDLTDVPTRTNEIIPIARASGVQWRYTLQAPPANWNQPTFRDLRWEKGESGFGTVGSAHNPKRTDWKTPEIWIRRAFRIVPGDSREFRIEICHDDDATVYVNGVVAVQASGWSNGEYRTFPFSKEGRAALVNGRNIIAVHCRNNTGPGYLDVGLIEVSR